MEISVQLSFLSSILLLLCTALPLTHQELLKHFCIYERGNFTANSYFSSNLDRLYSTLSSAGPSPGGFYNISLGESPDQVNSLVLCRGDVASDTCLRCIANATSELRSRCPSQKEAIIWYDECMFRYSNRSIFRSLEIDLLFYVWNDKQNVTSKDLDNFNTVLNDLMHGLRIKAAGGGSLRKFAAGSSALGPFQRIYGLVQCTPDLSEPQCNSCLVGYIQRIPTCCSRRIGGRVIGPSCNFRYENQTLPFYDPNAEALTSSPPLPSTVDAAPPPSNERGRGGSKSRTIIVSILSIVVFIAIVAFTCTLLRRHRQKPLKQEIKVRKEIESVESLQFEFSIIREATDDFSEDNKLGEGGFGAVYKGKLPDGQEIAVKRLSKNSNQGRKEFENEVLLMAKLQHRNLVKLLGFSTQEEERLLVYEFMPQSSLDKYLFDPAKSLLLDWDKRYKIIAGIAKGTLYLHEDSQLRIIHRDLKASNILLGTEMNPKISDFGMAMLFPVDITQANASRIVGTLGYMAPEYVQGGHVSVKIDVYSFGVLVLEIISGQKISNFGGEKEEFVNLLSYAWDNWRKGTAQNLVDPNLGGALESEVMRCIHLALLCVQENPTHRPSMAAVVVMLSSSSISMAVPSKPAFLLHSLMTSEISASARYGARMTTSAQFENKNISNNEASLSELSPR